MLGMKNKICRKCKCEQQSQTHSLIIGYHVGLQGVTAEYNCECTRNTYNHIPTNWTWKVQVQIEEKTPHILWPYNSWPCRTVSTIRSNAWSQEFTHCGRLHQKSECKKRKTKETAGKAREKMTLRISRWRSCLATSIRKSSIHSHPHPLSPTRPVHVLKNRLRRKITRQFEFYNNWHEITGSILMITSTCRKDAVWLFN